MVKIEEPDENTATLMLRGVSANFEKHHGVVILDEAIREAVRLSQRYITGRQLPEKAVSVLDTACARVAIGQNITPPEIESVVGQKERLELEVSLLKREDDSGLNHGVRLDKLAVELEALEKIRLELETRWKAELESVASVLTLQGNLAMLTEGDEDVREQIESIGRELAIRKKELEKIQQDNPMVPICVDARTVAAVISNWTGIPVGKMLKDEVNAILNLKEEMGRRVIGQPQALDAICRRIQTFGADLDDPGKPVGVFLLVGPSGIGKTETALTLADLLYGGERNLVSLNMSEYQEAYTVSGLKGAPPGYVGHGKGGVLTEAVRRNPYTVILLDEVEKAHSDVLELFYQVFDKGTLEDTDGLSVDFRNTTILLTSNIGGETIVQSCRDSGAPPDPETMIRVLRAELVKYFKPAFLARLVVVPFYPLGKDEIQRIVQLKLADIQRRFKANQGAELTWGQNLTTAIAARCNEVNSGARNVDYFLTQVMLPELSGELLKRMVAGKGCERVHVYMNALGVLSYRFEPPPMPTEPALPLLKVLEEMEMSGSGEPGPIRNMDMFWPEPEPDPEPLAEEDAGEGVEGEPDEMSGEQEHQTHPPDEWFPPRKQGWWGGLLGRFRS